MKKNVVAKVLAGCMALAVAVTGITVAAPATAKADTTYHAYIGFQSPAYSFRNEWADGSYGYGTDEFNQITGWAGSDEVTVPGTFNDAEITGDGTYTVSVTDIDWGDYYGDESTAMNLIFVSTDIPDDGSISVSDVSLKIDGNDVSLASAGALANVDEEEYFVINIQNMWNDDLKEIGYYNTPMSSIEVTFTISGVPTGDAATSDDSAAADSGSSESTGTADMIPVAGIVVALLGCGVVAFAVRKKVSR
ncbi:MAG: hypothetical protein LUI02_00445 [Clostridiales bacterium]|nr:hypothetical protein [Clostridiales bacterium]